MRWSLRCTSTGSQAVALPCQPLDVSLLHRGDEHPRRFGEKPRRLEDDFGPGRNAPAIFSSLGWSTGILRADRASARTECPASRAALTVSRPIPLLAPKIRTIATRHAPGRTRLAHLHVRCRQLRRKMG